MKTSIQTPIISNAERSREIALDLNLPLENFETEQFLESKAYSSWKKRIGIVEAINEAFLE